MKALIKTALLLAGVASVVPALAQVPNNSGYRQGYQAPGAQAPYNDPRYRNQQGADPRYGDPQAQDSRDNDPRYDDRRYGTRGDDRAMRDAAGRINDPRTQRAVGNAMAAMVDAMLDIRLDGIRNAVAGVDPRAGYGQGMRDRYGRPAQTLRDVVERNDPYFSRRIQSEAVAATRGIGAASQAAVDIAPEMRRAAERVARAVDEAVRRAR